jgi:hypothetical protein
MIEGFDWFKPEDLPILFKALRATDTPTILVGGQSLTFWVDFFGIDTPSTETPYLTQDADIFANKNDAKVIAEHLNNSSVKYPDIGDNTISTPLIVFEIGGRKLYLDVIGTLCGLTDQEVKETSIQLEIKEYGEINMLHPRLVMVSRISNLETIRTKRTKNGIIQAELSIDVYKRFLIWYRQFIDSDDEYQKYLIDRANELKKIALSSASVFVFKTYGINVLDSFPIELVTNEKFIKNNWSHIKKWFAERVEKGG